MKLLNFNEFVDHVNEQKEINEFGLILESFNSSIIRTLASNPKGGIGKRFFDTLSKQMGVAASDITNLDITTITPAEAAKWTSANPNHILVLYSNTAKPNPFAGKDAWGDERTIPANTVLAIIKGKLYMGLSYDRWASKNGKAEYKIVPSADSSLGINKERNSYGSGLNTLKKMAEVADIVYVIDPSTVPSSTQLRIERKEAKAGASAFIDDKQFKQENQSRYEAILRDRASNTDIDKLVQDAIDELTTQIKDAMANKSKSQYGDVLIGLSPKGREIKMSDAGNLMNQILRDYGYYATALNNAEESAKRHGEVDNYYANSAKQYAKTLKDHYNKIKAKNYAW